MTQKKQIVTEFLTWVDGLDPQLTSGVHQIIEIGSAFCGLLQHSHMGRVDLKGLVYVLFWTEGVQLQHVAAFDQAQLQILGLTNPAFTTTKRGRC